VTFEKPGDVVQIDTLSVTVAPGFAVKHFDAYDPFAKWAVARPLGHRQNAARFLAKVLAEMPPPVKAIQIDGGSEFMAAFEQACADRKLPLYIRAALAEAQGAVERCDAAWRYEFYACVELPEKSTAFAASDWIAGPTSDVVRQALTDRRGLKH
jgi:putative transposase